MGLYRLTLSSIKWSFLSTIGKMIVQFLLEIFLARLLLPQEYGLLAMSLVVIYLSRNLIDSGLYQALIQKKKPKKEDFSTVFLFNLFFSIFLSVLIFLLSGSLSRFYNEVNISRIVKFLSVCVIIEALSIIQRVFLIRELKFALIAKIEITTRFLSGIVAITLAYYGAGVWSLVVREIMNSVLTTLLYWMFSPLQICLIFDRNRLKNLFSFGFKIFIADQLESLSNYISQLIIGKMYSPTTLGYYSKAFQMDNIVSQTGIVSINKVIFPAFSKRQDNNEKLKESYKVLMKISMMVVFPIIFSIYLVSHDLILFTLGQQWKESSKYFQILCIGGIFYPLTVFNLNIIKVKGEGNLYLRTCLLTKGLLLPAIIFGLMFGVFGLVVAIVVHRFFSSIINSNNSGRLINYSLKEQISDIFPFFSISLLSFFLTKIFVLIFIMNIQFVSLRISLTIIFLLIVYIIILFFIKFKDIKNLLYKFK